MLDNTVDASPSKNPNDYVEPRISADPLIVIIAIIVLLIIIYVISKIVK